MKVIGIDLSGPANHKDTALIVFNKTKNHELTFERLYDNISDQTILEIIENIALNHNDIVIGMDAQLSYQDGGGYRPQDKALQAFLKENNLPASSIMAPTLTKMVYLTVRGIALTRSLMMNKTTDSIKIVEVHPGAVLRTRINKGSIQQAMNYKKDPESHQLIVSWLTTQNLLNLPTTLLNSSHTTDAALAALGAWHWYDALEHPKWVWNKTNLAHPFAYCC